MILQNKSYSMLSLFCLLLIAYNFLFYGSECTFGPLTITINGTGISCAGITGPTGPAGTRGTTGATGASGAIGKTGATGAAGLKGATGAAGSKGATGATGPGGTESALVSTKLLIYYGYPSLLQVNGIAIPTIDGIAQALSEYDVIVLGAGLEVPSHSDYVNTATIISKIHALKPSVLIFGYIDLGVSTSNFTIAQMQSFTDQWHASGADGIFWDDAGYDFNVTRQRQNNMILYARSKGMPSFMNAWNLEDIFSSTTVAAYNPTGMPTVLGPNDWFLLESLPYNNEVTSGPWALNSGWLDRSSLINTIAKAHSYRTSFGSKIAAVSIVNYLVGATATTTPAKFRQNNSYNQYVRNMVQAIGFVASFDACGDSAQGFSAFGPNANQIFKGWYDPEMERYSTHGPQIFTNDGPAGSTLTRYDYYTVVYYQTGNRSVETPLSCAPLYPFVNPSGLPPAGVKGRIAFGDARTLGIYHYDNGSTWLPI